MKAEQLTEICKKHNAWVCGLGSGKRADLRGAGLPRADLTGANLFGANLSGAYLTNADLAGANLTWTYLTGADLRGANLTQANLRGADLTGANLSGANLAGVKANHLTSGFFMCCPESGAFEGWKNLRNGRIAHIRIPADARRSSATTRKCRAERAEVLAVYDNEESVDCGYSIHDSNFMYRVGETVECDEWDDDRWNECSGGIHFFLTRAEAKVWA